jgi:hypothetical protein
MEFSEMKWYVMVFFLSYNEMVNCIDENEFNQLQFLKNEQEGKIAL